METVHCKCGTKLRPQVTLHEGNYEGSCPSCGATLRFRATAEPPRTAAAVQVQAASADVTVNFTVNGKAISVLNPDPAMSLNEYIRRVLRLKGTKLSCGEGGCGACIVNLFRTNPTTGSFESISVNSCLRLVASMDGWNVMTIEGVGNRTSGYHPIQKVIASYNGTQCGFCTSGFVMTMFSYLATNPNPTKQQIEDLFDGNICRCTGYRPILDAMKTFAVDQAGAATTDIEDLGKLKASVACCNLPCAKDCSAPSARPKFMKYVVNGVQWVRPVSLAELYGAINVAKSQPYRLVFGNTSTGIFKTSNAMTMIDVSAVKELQTVTSSAAGVVGAGISISGLIKALEDQSGLSKSYPTLVAHLLKIASINIRNAGCWAGNLMLTHDNIHFPSDIFTIMAGAGATLLVANAADQTASTYSLMDWLSVDMTGKLIVSLTIPVLQDGEEFVTFKIMPRHQNAHAYVNAAFRIQHDASWKVTSVPTMIFGGIGPYAVSAMTTATALNGQVLTSQDVLQAALASLGKELVPDVTPVSSSAAYRVSLSQGLLYKALLSFLPNISPAVQSAGKPFIRPISSGTQTYQTDPAEYPVSAPVGKPEAIEQAAGEAQYLDDRPAVEGLLYGAFMIADSCNCTLVGIDTTAVLAANGVVKVFTAPDLPAANNFIAGSDPEILFAPLGSTVEYAGQAVGMVIADTQAHANAAAKLVVLKYANQRPPVLDVRDAMAAKSFFECTVAPVVAGLPIDQALQQAKHVVTGEVFQGGQYHFHMETHVAEAAPTDDGGVDIWSGTQTLDGTQQSVAQVLNLPANKVRVNVMRIGGSYGAKITRGMYVSAAAAVAAKLMNGPVRFVVDLNTTMQMMGKRHPWLAQYSVGFDDTGKLQAVKIDYYADAGCGRNDTTGTLSMAATSCDNAYYCANWQVTPYICKTNTAANTYARGPGCFPAIFVMETVVDHVAQSLGLAPDQVRMNNLYQAGQVTPYNDKLVYCSIGRVWQQLLVDSDFQNRAASDKVFNSQNRWRKRGIAMVPMKYGLTWAGQPYAAYVSICGDGTVAISHGGVEVGQGIHAKVSQVVAYKFGVPLSLISVNSNNAFLFPNSPGTGGSTTSELCCQAVSNACDILLGRIQPVQQQLSNPTWQQIIQACVGQFVDLAARGIVAVSPDWPVFNYNSFGSMVTEVEIDVLTGELQILRADVLLDCGQSLNPVVDVGQVEGALAMGFGNFTSEHLIWDKSSGKLLTDGTWEYKPPESKDIPIDLRVSLLQDAPNPAGFMRSKAVGEPPQCMSGSIVFAIKSAVLSAIADAKGTAPFSLDVPLTTEAIQQACQVQPSQFTY